MARTGTIEVSPVGYRARLQAFLSEWDDAIINLGGPGSGHHGHTSVEGQRGGSAPGHVKVAYQKAPDAHAFIEARDRSTRKGYLSPLTPDDLKDQKIYFSEDGTVGGAVTKDGDMGNLFNNGGPPGAAREVLIDMIKDGGKTADAFDGYLPTLYANFGLRETGRMKFNPAYAPPGWDFERNDHPDVVFLARTSEAAEEAGSEHDIRARLKDKGQWIPPTRSTKYYDDYDEAKRDATAAADASRARSLSALREGAWRGVDQEARRDGAGGSASLGRSVDLRGNEHSGNHGHKGRPGEVGGSGPGVGPMEDRLRKSWAATENPHETGFLLPDGSRIKKAWQTHEIMARGPRGTQSDTGKEDFWALMDEGVIRYVPGQGVMLTRVPTHAQADAIVDDWKTYYEGDQLRVDFSLPGTEGGVRSHRKFNDRVTGEALRNWVEQQQYITAVTQRAAALEAMDEDEEDAYAFASREYYGFDLRGTESSGNYGHAGRPGLVGGSAPSEGGGGDGDVTTALDAGDRQVELRPATEADAKRIAKLQIPPAYRSNNVMLSDDPKADLQATWTDDAGRTQYRYSAQHTKEATAEKFARLKEFNAALPKLRERIAADMADDSLSASERDAAAILHLIDVTGFRPGSESETGGAKKAYGASTLKAGHVRINGDKISFRFPAKSGVTAAKTITNPVLAKLLTERKAQGGFLFPDASDSDVRDYLHSRDGDFKPKDFRTWNGTNKALQMIAKMPVPKTEAKFKIAQRTVVKAVAKHLGNTPSVAMKSYIDPAVWSKWKAKQK